MCRRLGGLHGRSLTFPCRRGFSRRGIFVGCSAVEMVWRMGVWHGTYHAPCHAHHRRCDHGPLQRSAGARTPRAAPGVPVGARFSDFARWRMSRPGGVVFVVDHGENRRPRSTSRPSKALSELSGSTRSQLGRSGVARRDAVARAALQARELAPADELDRGVEVGEGHLRVRQRRHIWRRAELGLNPHHAAAAAAVAVAAARLRSASRPGGQGGGRT